YLMSTTSGGAARVLTWLEEWLQTEWPDLQVFATSVTEQWATVSLSGPHSRQLVEELVEDVDLGPEAFPHMSVRDARIGTIPVRLFRISFTGEMGFEIQIPADYGLTLWERCIDLGERYDLAPFGTEAMHVLRAEKGYIITGQDTDGTATPTDLGMDWIMSKKKGDFVGKRSLARADMQRDDRKQLVGLLPKDPAMLLEEGAQIIADPNQTVPMTMIGHVTSSYRSPALGRTFALAMVKEGRSKMGGTVYVPMIDQTCAVTVTDPVFIDKEGARLHG
ncbi:MAG: glycine cleavage T C-terminal barrel domain-containing protein, partial [Geminicoccaceae bacterium]